MTRFSLHTAPQKFSDAAPLLISQLGEAIECERPTCHGRARGTGAQIYTRNAPSLSRPCCLVHAADRDRDKGHRGRDEGERGDKAVSGTRP